MATTEEPTTKDTDNMDRETARELIEALRSVRNALYPKDCCGHGTDATGGIIDSVMEAVMGCTAAISEVTSQLSVLSEIDTSIRQAASEIVDNGLSIRMKLASMAMNGILASGRYSDGDYDELAEASFRIAAQMLKSE